MNRPAEYAKAIVGALVAAASFAIPVVDDGLVASEALGILVAALAAFTAVWGVPNADPQHPQEETFLP